MKKVYKCTSKDDNSQIYLEKIDVNINPKQLKNCKKKCIHYSKQWKYIIVNYKVIFYVNVTWVYIYFLPSARVTLFITQLLVP